MFAGPPNIAPQHSRGASLISVRHIAAVAAISLAAPLAARAKPTYSLIVQRGDQTDPSIDGQYVVYASNASGTWDVLRYEIGAKPPTPLITTIAGGPENEDQPDVSGAKVIYRGPGGIHIQSWLLPWPVRSPQDPGPKACPYEAPVSNPTISEDVAAWECGDNAHDIAVFRSTPLHEEYRLVRPGATDAAGDQHGPSTFGSLVAFVDASDGGSVWLHDSDPDHRVTRFVCAGHATGVSVGRFGGTMLAVARASGGPDHDIEVWDASEPVATLVAALRVPGEQQNPHISLDWVAFEDLSTGHPQVVLWQWTSGLVFVPHPSKSKQTLNDLATVPGLEVRVVFAEAPDGSEGARDIALYQLLFEDGEIPGDGQEWPPIDPTQRPPPASCDDPHPVVLATLTLGREPGKPLAESATFDAPPFPGDPALPVLVCIDADRVTSGWVTFDDRAVAMPGDLHTRTTRLEIPTVAESGQARISGVIAGKPGASLVARVLADPGRPRPGLGADGVFRALPHVAPSALQDGCGNVGGAWSLAGLALLLAVRLARRR